MKDKGDMNKISVRTFVIERLLFSKILFQTTNILRYDYNRIIKNEQIAQVIDEITNKINQMQEGIYICTDIFASQKENSKWIDVTVQKITRDEKASVEKKKPNANIKAFAPY